MPAPFTVAEYDTRLARVREAMQASGLDALLIGDPANMNWLTGFDAWSFYVPQLMLVTGDRPPVWMGRAMDRGAVFLTTWLPEECAVAYPEHLVQREGVHPMDFIGERLAAMGLRHARVGYESDVYFFSPKSLALLQQTLPEADFIDADLLVNWARAVKSEAEIAVMRHAAAIAGNAMRTACEGVRPGVRQCDLMARIVAAQVAGTPDAAGDLTALSPLILAGKAAATAHPLWTGEAFAAGQTVAFELGGAHRRYNVGLARTVQLGTPPKRLLDTAAAVEEGLEAAIGALGAGVTCGEVHAAWQRVLDRHGLVKESRIGYSIGVGYSPDWGEHTISLRAGERTVLEAGNVLHIILGMWMDDWGMELSETVLVRDQGAECLTDFPRAVQPIG